MKKFTIDKLTEIVGRAVAVAGCDDQPSGRVRDVPNERAIRYYTTLGLLDKPDEMRGRTALYSRRHLLQLVTIKRLQAEGLSLAEIQKRLLSASDEELMKSSGLPEGYWDRLGGEREESSGGSSVAARNQRYWEELPADPSRAGMAGQEIPTLHYPVARGIKLVIDVNNYNMSEISEFLIPELQKLSKRLLTRGLVGSGSAGGTADVGRINGSSD
jgi:DNA-binding transcriptional MerR regulator